MMNQLQAVALNEGLRCKKNGMLEAKVPGDNNAWIVKNF